MITIVEKRVFKDAENFPKYAQELAAQQIEVLKASATLNDVPNIRPMKGTAEPYYRLRFGEYRFMLYYDKETETIKVLSLKHRKDAYKKQHLPWR